jgi:pimeloyl-ACP methyl ester carboxylesterase
MKILKWGAVALIIIIGIVLITSYKADIPFEVLKQKYAHPESKFMDIDGMQVHYRDEGNPIDSIPLVLIHGTSSSLHTWDDCTNAWKKKHRVIRFDIPAFGLTGPNKKDRYTFDMYVDFVNKVLEKLNVKNCYIMGNSLGGGVAWQYAYKYPQKAKKLILCDANGYKFKAGKGGLGFNIIKKVGKIPVLKNTLYYITPDNTVKKSVEAVYFDKSKVKDKTVELYMDFMLREGNRKALVSRLLEPVQDNDAKIKSLKIPTLIVWGEHDELIPVEFAHQFHKNIANSELAIIKNSGHIPMEESPEEVIPIVENFISK